MEKPTATDRADPPTAAVTLAYQSAPTVKGDSVLDLAVSVVAGLFVLAGGLVFALCAAVVGSWMIPGRMQSTDPFVIVASLFVMGLFVVAAVVFLMAAWNCLVRVPRQFGKWRR